MTGHLVEPRAYGVSRSMLGQARDAIVTELRKTIVGMDEVIDEMMIAIFARGHCLLVGVPGLAKTLMVSTLADILDVSFKRIKFTPELMPSDITGTEVLVNTVAGLADGGR